MPQSGQVRMSTAQLQGERLDKNYWIDYIVSSETAYEAFLAYCDQRIHQAQDKLVRSYRHPEGSRDADLACVEAETWGELRQMIKRFKEEKKHGAKEKESTDAGE